MPLKHSFELSNRYDAPLYKCDKGVQASRAIDQDLRIFRSSIFPASFRTFRKVQKFKVGKFTEDFTLKDSTS